MGSGTYLLLAQPVYGFESALLGGSSGAVGDRKIERTEPLQSVYARFELLHTGIGFGRKQLETESFLVLLLGFHICFRKIEGATEQRN